MKGDFVDVAGKHNEHTTVVGKGLGEGIVAGSFSQRKPFTTKRVSIGKLPEPMQANMIGAAFAVQCSGGMGKGLQPKGVVRVLWEQLETRNRCKYINWIIGGKLPYKRREQILLQGPRLVEHIKVSSLSHYSSRSCLCSVAFIILHNVSTSCVTLEASSAEVAIRRCHNPTCRTRCPYSSGVMIPRSQHESKASRYSPSIL